MHTRETISQLAWDKMDGLLPARCSTLTGEVLMLGYMSADAVSETLQQCVTL